MIKAQENENIPPAGDLTIAPERDDEILSTFAKYTAFKRQQKHSGKLYYSISEVAALFGINASKIRFWEKEFDVIKPRKNSKGNRFFTQQDIDNIGLIYHLTEERGMTLKGARQKIKENKEDTKNTFQVIKSLQKVRTMLLEIKDNIEE